MKRVLQGAKTVFNLVINNSEGPPKKDPTEREEGFYWVRRHDVPDEVTVGEWDMGSWFLCGNDWFYNDSEIAVLSERLVPPGEEG